MSGYPCTRNGCRRITTDPSRRCHDHRRVDADSPPPPYLLMPPGPMSPNRERVEIESMRGGGDRERFFDGHGHVYRVIDRHPNGTISCDSYSDPWGGGAISRRGGGPAVTEYDENGVLMREEWIVDNYSHRADGPAEIRYRPDGTVKRALYRLDRRALADRGELVRALRRKTGIELASELRDSSFAPLVIEGVPLAQILDVFEAGVSTVEGIREVLGGTPVEWVVAYEEGQDA